jgi:hypothetical protein
MLAKPIAFQNRLAISRVNNFGALNQSTQEDEMTTAINERLTDTSMDTVPVPRVVFEEFHRRINAAITSTKSIDMSRADGDTAQAIAETNKALEQIKKDVVIFQRAFLERKVKLHESLTADERNPLEQIKDCFPSEDEDRLKFFLNHLEDLADKFTSLVGDRVLRYPWMEVELADKFGDKPVVWAQREETLDAAKNVLMCAIGLNADLLVAQIDVDEYVAVNQ